jgi:hypothetical protein
MPTGYSTVFSIQSDAALAKVPVTPIQHYRGNRRKCYFRLKQIMLNARIVRQMQSGRDAPEHNK